MEWFEGFLLYFSAHYLTQLKIILSFIYVATGWKLAG